MEDPYGPEIDTLHFGAALARAREPIAEWCVELRFAVVVEDRESGCIALTQAWVVPFAQDATAAARGPLGGAALPPRRHRGAGAVWCADGCIRGRPHAQQYGGSDCTIIGATGGRGRYYTDPWHFQVAFTRVVCPGACGCVSDCLLLFDYDPVDHPDMVARSGEHDKENVSPAPVGTGPTRGSI